jgi:hypothetical protein
MDYETYKKKVEEIYQMPFTTEDQVKTRIVSRLNLEAEWNTDLANLTRARARLLAPDKLKK